MIIGISGSAGSGKDTAAAMLQARFGKSRVHLIAFAEPIKLFCQKVFKFSDEQCWGSLQNKSRPDPRYPRPGSREHWDNASVILRGEAGAQLCIDAANACPYVSVYEAFKSLVFWFSKLSAGKWSVGDAELNCREALQTLGTEWGRDDVHYDIWANLGLARAKEWGNRVIPCAIAPPPCADWSFQARLSDTPCISVITDVRFSNEMAAIKKAGGQVIRLTRTSPTEIGGVAGHASEAEQLSSETLGLVDHFVKNTGTKELLDKQICTLVHTLLPK